MLVASRLLSSKPPELCEHTWAVLLRTRPQGAKLGPCKTGCHRLDTRGRPARAAKLGSDGKSCPDSRQAGELINVIVLIC